MFWKKSGSVEEEILKALQKRDLKKAVRLSSSQETPHSDHDFPVIDSPGITYQVLWVMFNRKPKILRGIRKDKLQALRVATGITFLFGENDASEWLPPDFDTGIQMPSEVAGRMLLFFALSQRNLADYKESGVVTGVRVLSTDDSCPACKAISKKLYKLSKAPELPYEKCTHELGCRCAYGGEVD